MIPKSKLLAKSLRFIFPMLLSLLIFPGAARAQFLTVDCSGMTPGAYSSINAALPAAGPGAFIVVTGTCNEYVSLQGQNALNLGAFFGQTATISGNISINNSQNVFLYGLQVTNPAGDGINISNSRSIVVDSCSSSGNAGVGLNVGGGSDVTINAMGTFDNNAKGGISIFGNAIVEAFAWGGPVDISGNAGPGVWAGQASFVTLGHTTIANNTFGPGANSGFGLDLRGAARAQLGTVFGPNVITGNQSGGAWLQETSEISFWFAGYPNLIQSNGPVGVLAGFGSQVTFFNSAQISGHTNAGVDLYANSQGYFSGANTIQNNGSSADARSAGIRVDGNSEALLRGGQLSGNSGPGILALVNSSVDLSGVTFSGNSQIIACDSSSTMVSDLTQPNSFQPAGVSCRTPHGLGGRQLTKSQPTAPGWTAEKSQHDRYSKMAVKH
jgi:Right handed beta helix region